MTAWGGPRCTAEIPAAGLFLRDLLIHSFIHHLSLHSFVHSCSLSSTCSLSLRSHCSFVYVPLPLSLAALFSPLPSSQQVAHISSPVLFTLIGQSFDRPRAGASTQLRQLHEVNHSISCRIFHSFIKSLSIEWEFYVWFILFCRVYSATKKANKKSKNTLNNCKVFI